VDEHVDEPVDESVDESVVETSNLETIEEEEMEHVD